MNSYVHKWGNNLGIRIPKQLAKKLHLHPGSAVTIEIENGKLVVQAPQYDLDAMLEAITAENRHHLLIEDEQTRVEERLAS